MLTSTFEQKSILSDHILSNVELIEHVSNVRLECERDELLSTNLSLRVPSSICEKIFTLTYRDKHDWHDKRKTNKIAITLMQFIQIRLSF